jgi:cobalt/nickel transport system permease protein
MHIPDGFLSTPVWATLDAVSVPAISLLAGRARREIDQLQIPFLGVMGAFVFAAQMINFPVGLGTSGHLVGGALLACLLGPGAAALVMTAILAIQAFVFQDGGIIVLGANVLNMAVAGVLAGYLPYHLLAGRARSAGVFVGAFLSVLVSASLALGELLLSGVQMPRTILGVSIALFVVSALIEAVITVAVVKSIERLHPGWIAKPRPMGSSALVLIGAAAVLLAAMGVLFASQSPDGIEHLALQAGIADRARAVFATPFTDYQFHAIQSPWLRRAAAGLAGVFVIWGFCLLVGRMAVKRDSPAPGGA